MPAVLFGDIGPRQYPAGTLHREVQSMQHSPHVAGMVMNAELLLNHPSNHRRSPYPGIQSVGHRTAVENIAELFPLLRTQAGGPARPISFQQALHSVGLIA